MRTNIDIDDSLMQRTLLHSEGKTKKAAVEEAMRMFVRIKDQGKAIRQLRGKIHWEGDLEESRTNKLPDDAWTR